MNNKLTKTLLALTILSGSLNAMATDWRVFHRDNDGSMASYNADNIFTQNGYKGVQVLFDSRPSGQVHETDDGRTANNFTMIFYFKCAQKLTSFGPAVFYMDTQEVGRKDNRLRWRKVERNTPDERLMNIVCKKK